MTEYHFRVIFMYLQRTVVQTNIKILSFYFIPFFRNSTENSQILTSIVLIFLVRLFCFQGMLVTLTHVGYWLMVVWVSTIKMSLAYLQDYKNKTKTKQTTSSKNTQRINKQTKTKQTKQKQKQRQRKNKQTKTHTTKTNKNNWNHEC